MLVNRRLSVFLVSCALVTTAAEARVVRLVVDRATPVANGTSFGSVGPYERLDGTVYFEVDPRDPLNLVIVNLDKAPRNAKGLVEFSAPFVIIKPVDVARGNSKILYGINNRGNNIEIPFQTLPASGNNAAPDLHDGFLYRLGYTFVDAGWAGDITTSLPRVGANLPVAVGADGKPLSAPIRIEYTGTGFTLPLKGNNLFRSYETADTDTTHATLTVRSAIAGEKRPIPSSLWAYGKCPNGRESLQPTATDICLFEGFRANHIYELTYQATKPWVMGLGFAVTRDLASFLRFETKDSEGHPNPIARPGASIAGASAAGVRRAYGLGISSTGMYMREFLYLGFNEDEGHRKVFDAVRILIPGTHRLFMNVAFSDPNVYSRQDQHPDFLSHSLPPFTYAVTTDPLTGVRDGILKRPATDPLVFHVDTANEFWQMNASLNMHDGKRQAVPVPETVRYYFAASHSHIGASGVGATPTSAGTCAYPTNGGLSYNALLRALLVALDDWADRGIAPPPSRYPSLADGTLVTVDDAAKAFPRIPAVAFPTVINVASTLDYGASLKPTGGALTKLPPVRGASYPALVPKPDADGLDLGGIRTLDVAVPIGTNTGWNLWAPGPRGADLCGLQGSFFPFSRTKAEREGRGDARPSLEERYKDHAGFVAAVERAAQDLVKQRFLLQDDAKTLVATAESSDVLR